MLAYKLVESGIVFYGYYATFPIKIVKITYFNRLILVNIVFYGF